VYTSILIIIIIIYILEAHVILFMYSHVGTVCVNMGHVHGKGYYYTVHAYEMDLSRSEDTQVYIYRESYCLARCGKGKRGGGACTRSN